MDGRRTRLIRKVVAAGVSALVLATGLVATTSIAAVAAPGVINASQTITKTSLDTDGVVAPGESFSYGLAFSCGTSLPDVSGCEQMTITDLLPVGVEYVGTSAFPAGVPGTVTVNDVGGQQQVVITFTAAINVPEATTGAPLGSGQMTLQVRLADDIPWERDGEILVNEADLTSFNANPVSDTADIAIVVDPVLDTSASKSFAPTQNFNTPGLQTTLTMGATNATNGGVDALVVQDPAGADPLPTDDTNPFFYLEFTDFGAMTMPAGADAVTAEVWTATDGWVTVYSGAGPPVYPGAPATEDVFGVRFTYTSSTGGTVDRDASASAAVELTQRDNVDGLPATTVTNTATSAVTLGGDTVTSPEADADYTIVPFGIGVDAAKQFAPNEINAGESTTVILGATNTGTAPLTSLTITEPGTANPDALAGDLEFAGFTGGVQWPAGATSATIVYQYEGGAESAPLSTTDVDTLPASPGAERVIGFEVTFTAPAPGMPNGAEALVPFTVDTTRADTPPDLVEVPNDVVVDGVSLDDPTQSATDDADDVLQIFGDRIAIDVSKSISPSQAWLIPGQSVIAQIPAVIAGFPETTVNPDEVVVEDTADQSPGWWNLYDPTELTQLGIPDNATLTVYYETETTSWTELPGAVDLAAPPAYQTVPIDPALSPTITGLRFVYTADDGESFEPGSTFQPNITFTTRDTTRYPPIVNIEDVTPNGTIVDPDDLEGPGIPVVIEGNCAAAGASSSTPALDADTAVTDPCPVVTLVPVAGDGPDLIDKVLSPVGVVERTQDAAAARLGWSTGGLTGVVQQYVTETGTTSGAPAEPGTYDTSFFNAFDLVSLDAITTSTDPRMLFDRIAAIELFNAQTGDWEPIAGAPWDGPTAGGGVVFGGYTLTDAERERTTGVRYLIEESPNRADVLTPGDLSQPAIGSGVTASTDRRPITLRFELRDERRSDSSPVLANETYNASDLSVVANTATSEACFTAFVAGICADGFDDSDGDTITILNGTASITTTKSWTGGPIGIPPLGTPADEYPSTRATLDVINDGPQKVDTLTLSDPAPNTAFNDSAFDAFTLTGIVSVTPPSGADTTTVELTIDGGATVGPLTIAQATSLEPDDLVNVVGVSTTSDGRIDAGAGAQVVLDLQLRAMLRHDAAIAVSPATIPNTLFGAIADPSVEAAGSCAPSDPLITPPANTVIGCGSADLVLTGTQERTVEANKSFLPENEQYENDDTRFTMLLTGRPDGTARSNQVVLTDDTASFWNAYGFGGLSNNFAIVAPANRVQVEVLTGQNFVATGNTLTATGGSWSAITGGDGDSVWMTEAEARAASAPGGPGTALVLESGEVDYRDVQGVRFTFQRVAAGDIADPDAALLLLENPATPTLQARLMLDRRDDLLSGGAVPSTLPGNTPAPGTTTAGQYPNEVTADATGFAGNGAPATDDAEADMWFRHLPTSATTVKTPTGAIEPGEDFTVTLTTTNDGSFPILNPVIVDDLPVGGIDAGLPDFVFPDGVDATDPDTYTFTRSGGTSPEPDWSPLPVDTADVDIDVTTSGGTDAEPVSIRFAFDDGSALGIGEVYTISWTMQLRLGAVALETFTNAYDIEGDRAFDACNGVDDIVDSCGTTAEVSAQPLAALDMRQSVRATDDELGVISTTSATCTPADADEYGYYVAPCVPVTKPGDTNSWSFDYVNVGTYPLDTVSGVVYLPRPGPSGIDIPATDSEWLPTLLTTAVPQFPDNPGATLTLHYTTDSPGTALCTDVLSIGGDCPPGYWMPFNAATVDLDTVTALYFTVDFTTANDLYNPSDQFFLEFQTTAPAFAVEAATNPITWNSVKTGGTYTDPSGPVTLAPFEVPIDGAALATGSITLEKTVDGAASDEDWVPSTFDGTLSCISAGETVPADSLPSIPSLTPGVPVTIDGLPWGAECSFVEDEAGSVVTLSPNPVVALTDPTLVEAQGVTNTYEYASLIVDKTVVAPTGYDIPTGYEFTAVCTYLGAEVLNETFNLNDEGSITFDELPARAECTVTETDDRNADSTVTSVDVVDPTATPTVDQATSAAVIPELSPDSVDGDTQNSVSFVNQYDVAGMTLVKAFEGAGAAQFGENQTFTLEVVCTFGGETLVDTSVELSASNGWTASLTGLIVGSECTVTEPDLAGADAVIITPNDSTDLTVGTVEVSEDEVVEVTATNWYLTGSLEVTKTFAGDGAEKFGTAEFDLQLSCVRDGEQVLIPLGDERTVDAGSPTALWENLPAGAECTLVELTTGGAGATAILSEDGSTVLADDATDGYTFTVVVDETILSVDDQPQPGLQVENTFNFAELAVIKLVETDAVDADGEPVEFGPFEVTLACMFDGLPVTAAEPMVRSIAEDETIVWTELPEGAECEVTETDAAGAASTTVTVLEAGELTVTDGDTAELAPLPQVGAEDQTAVGFTNVFEVASLEVRKAVEGSAADDVAGRTFPVDIVCVLTDASHPDGLVLRDETASLGDGQSTRIDDVPVGTVCTVTETDAGGADSTTISARADVADAQARTLDAATITVTLIDPLTITTLTNRFERPLPATGIALGWAVPLSAVLLMLVGGLLAASRRRIAND